MEAQRRYDQSAALLELARRARGCRHERTTLPA
jgi:hypothetical protein